MLTSIMPIFENDYIIKCRKKLNWYIWKHLEEPAVSSSLQQYSYMIPKIMHSGETLCTCTTVVAPTTNFLLTRFGVFDGKQAYYLVGLVFFCAALIFRLKVKAESAKVTCS